MFGASLYLSEGLENNLNYLEQMNKQGIRIVFTSLHIPENNSLKALEQLKQITAKMSSYNMNLIADISTETLKIYNIEKNNAVRFFKELGISYLRVDYGFSYEEMKVLSNKFKIVLNASTVDTNVCDALEKNGFSLDDIMVCHNFYPRENTGLSRHFLLEKNQFLKEKGFKVMAFIPGNKKKRGPIFTGLPTVEEHRKLNPLEAYLDLTEHLLVDDVFIGDISMEESSMSKIQNWIRNSVITLDLKETVQEVPKNFFEIHKNRKDLAADVIRASKSRIDLKETLIVPMNTVPRPRGAVTLDNKEYGRYSGEIQITKKDLREDERINVLAKVIEEDLGLLEYIVGDTKFEFGGE